MGYRTFTISELYAVVNEETLEIQSNRHNSPLIYGVPATAKSQATRLTGRYKYKAVKLVVIDMVNVD